MSLQGLNPNFPPVLYAPPGMHRPYLQGLNPNFPPVPYVPPGMHRPCVYGHIITEVHRNNFKEKYPTVAIGRIADLQALVSTASTYHMETLDDSVTTSKVYYGGEWCVCLVHVSDRRKIREARGRDGFVNAIEKDLGITGDPKWYPCYSD